jgi:preprotein translocase subunit SecD
VDPNVPVDPNAPVDPSVVPSVTNSRAIPYLATAATVDPAATEPAAPADPALTDPALTDPALTDPALTDPALTDPALTDPALTDPALTDPTAGTADLSQITAEMATQVQALDCTDPANRKGGIADAADKPLVTCSQDGSAKYILGPVEVEGARIKSASSGLQQNSQGVSTGAWAVQLEFDAEGTKKFAELSTRMIGLQAPQNQFAIVLDGLVVSAPKFNAVITDGKSEITGNFTRESAAQLANQLRFGALPLSFTVESTEQISALLGSEQLRKGLLAGLIGLALVVGYSLLQYRASPVA